MALPTRFRSEHPDLTGLPTALVQWQLSLGKPCRRGPRARLRRPKNPLRAAPLSVV